MASISVTISLSPPSGDTGIIGPATSISALNTLAGGTPDDGTIGILRTGSSTDTTDLLLIYNADRSLWVSDEFLLVRASDINAVLVQFYTETVPDWNISTGAGNAAFCSTSTMRRINDAMTAGLGVEHRMHAFMLGDQGGSHANINTEFYIYDVSDGSSIPDILSQPPAAAWAQTATINAGDGPSNVDYQWAEQAWTTLTAPGGDTLTAPDNTTAFAQIVCYVDHPGSGDASGDGQPIDTALFVRLVG